MWLPSSRIPVFIVKAVEKASRAAWIRMCFILIDVRALMVE